ncbi:hypothetical protein PFNF54_01636 [Plasmodium falciparum NF54]|nr:hypothetical protein PFNF54_01636 [Plasmodium falciparum NF54]
MKEVMDNFNRQTQQRFHEYDHRMKTTRQKCKEQCDKEIQKIILKDKLEKELMDKFATLHTDIQNDAIPTCVCEKSVADKVEKNCMKCTQNLGGIVAPSSGVLAGIAEGALYVWRDAEIVAAIAAAKEAGAAKGAAVGIKEGIKVLLNRLNTDFGLSPVRIKELESVINGTNYTDVTFIYEAIYTTYKRSCVPVDVSVRFTVADTDLTFCESVWNQTLAVSQRNMGTSPLPIIQKTAQKIVSDANFTAAATAETATEEATTTLTAKNTGEVNATYMGYQTPIIASIVAILVIVLVMIIIYLILRYRRKKKMKKKLQYIKLLEE